MKMALSWGMASCSLVEAKRCFGCPYCLHHQGDNDSMSYSIEWYEKIIMSSEQVFGKR
jgi:hypothetical protein